MTGAIIQARMNSSRLPGKIVSKLNGIPLLIHLINRTKKIKELDKIVIAMTDDPTDDYLENLAIENNFLYFRGSTNNVLQRYIECAEKNDIDIILRICGDSPLLDQKTASQMLNEIKKTNSDYCGVNENYSCAATGFEIFTFNALKKQLNYELQPHHYEHVSLFMRESDNFNKCSIIPDDELVIDDVRLTVDTSADLKLMTKIFSHFKNNDFTLRDALKYLNKNPDLKKINSHVHQKNTKQTSIRVLLIVKNHDENIIKNWKKVFTEKYHIGLKIINHDKVNNDFKNSLIKNEKPIYNFILHESKTNINNEYIPKIKIDLQTTDPYEIAQLIKIKLNL